MLENINYSLFALLNATPASSWWTIEIATFIAKDLIIIVPLLVFALWLWGPNQRQLVFKVMMALAISLTLSWIFGVFFPHERPFAAGVGYNFLHHSPNNSFPSNHGTICFTFALAFMLMLFYPLTDRRFAELVAEIAEKNKKSIYFIFVCSP